MIGSVLGGTIAWAVGIPGMFATTSVIGLVGTIMVALAVLGSDSRIGPALPGTSPPEAV